MCLCVGWDSQLGRAWFKSFQSHLFASVFRCEIIKPLLCWSHHWVISQTSSRVPLSIYEWHLNGVCPNRYTEHSTQKTYGNARAEFTEFWCSVRRRFYAMHFKSQNGDDEQRKEKKKVRNEPFSRVEKGKKSKFIFDFLFSRRSYLTNTSLRIDSHSALVNIFSFSFSFLQHFVWLQSDNVTHI